MNWSLITHPRKSLRLCFTHALVDAWSIGTMVVISQISIESPFSTNQQSFYGHGSDRKPWNFKLTYLHIIIWELNPPKRRYFILYWNKDKLLCNLASILAYTLPPTVFTHSNLSPRRTTFRTCQTDDFLRNFQHCIIWYD